VLSALDRVTPELQMRHITFRGGTDEMYVLTPENSHARWIAVIVPGHREAEVTVWQGNGPCLSARCDGDGVAVFADVTSGPVRFVYRRPECGKDKSVINAGIEVQTEWVLIS
jgi:hypothetical protein